MIPQLTRNIDCAIVADSLNPWGSRLTTFVLRYPRFIHAEFMTHRCFSRNAASSRAIPTERLLQEIEYDSAEFEQIGAANKGMQAAKLADLDDKAEFEAQWHEWGMEMSAFADSWQDKIAKQVINRALEPWLHITVVATATDVGLSNFFALRANKAAQPEFQVLAYRMLHAYVNNRPSVLSWKDWHVPFADGDDLNDVGGADNIERRIKVAVARCCWISYNKHGKENFELEDAYKRHDECIQFGHFSPLEHVAQAHATSQGESNFDLGHASGWSQYRKQFDNELADCDLHKTLEEKPDWISL